MIHTVLNARTIDALSLMGSAFEASRRGSSMDLALAGGTTMNAHLHVCATWDYNEGIDAFLGVQHSDLRTTVIAFDSTTRDALALMGSAFETSRDTDMYAALRDFRSDTAMDHNDSTALYEDALVSLLRPY